MTTVPFDQFLIDHAPAPQWPVAPALLSARTSLRAALAELRAIADGALERPWPWRGDDADVRYGLYRQYEALEEVRAAVRRRLAAAGAAEPPARSYLAAATAARWELHGLLAGLSDGELDRDPGNGEWTIRQTLAHIVNGQRAYGWFTAWWHSRRGAPADDFPPRVPDDAVPDFPEEETEGTGRLIDIQARLDDILDLAAGVFAGLDDEGLSARARWSGYPVDVRFRINRWSSHLREHTIQVDKTLVMLGRSTSEVERLLRLIGAAYGRVEEELYMWHPGTADDLAALVDSAVADLAAEAATVVAAAGSSQPESATAKG